jgi:outer membrane protein assembly factor BamB
MANYYELLDVSPGASPEEIQTRYASLAAAVDFEVDFKRSRQLQKAFAVLNDPGKRRQYDESLEVKVPLASGAGAASSEVFERPVMPPVPEAPAALSEATSEYRGLVKAVVASARVISPAQAQYLAKEATRLGLADEEADALRAEVLLRPVSKADLLKKKSCPRCEYRFNVFQPFCPRCELAQRGCPNTDCGALSHAPDAVECMYCGAPVPLELCATTFRGGPHRRGEVRDAVVRRTEFAWCRSLEQPIRASVVVGLGYVYVGTTGGQLHAFTQSGEGVTPSQFPRILAGGSILATPTFDGGVLYVATTGGSLYAIDAWTGEDRHPEVFLEAGVVASPLLHEGRLYVATLGGRVIAFESATMRPLWTYPGADAPPLGKLIASPTLLGDRLIVADDTGAVLAVDLDGDEAPTLAWRVEVGTAVLATPVARQRDVSIYGTDGRLLTVREDGTVTCQVNHIGSFVEGSPASWGGGLLFVGAANSNLYAQDPLSGALHEAYPVRNLHCNTVDAIQSSPLCVGDTVFFAGEAGILYGVRAAEAHIGWSYRVGAPVRSSPVFDGQLLYVGDDNGNLHAFKTKDGEV